VKRAGRKNGPAQARGYQDYNVREERGALREYGPIAFGGLMLVTAFAFAGHYMGQNAVAHNAGPDDVLDGLVAPSSNIVTKGSLLPDVDSLVIANTAPAGKQDVIETGKGDIVAVVVRQTTITKQMDDVLIIPAAVNLKEVDEPEAKKIAMTPPKAKIEQAFKLKRSEKQKVVAARRVQLAEENCLARAVYFEARSETELGQLAVAKVILNRVKDPEYPNTICGVVYQGSGRRNSCQFSFACDGLPDDVKSAGAWAHSKSIAQKALAGDAKVAAIGSATNYHADYVRPKWARNMKRLIKIGRHIFYSDS
jgi:spore germination cell wall hydrolase CwlJ-like protein